MKMHTQIQTAQRPLHQEMRLQSHQRETGGQRRGLKQAPPEGDPKFFTIFARYSLRLENG